MPEKIFKKLEFKEQCNSSELTSLPIPFGFLFSPFFERQEFTHFKVLNANKTLKETVFSKPVTGRTF